MAVDSSDRGLFYSMMKTSKLDAEKFDGVGGSPRKVKTPYYVIPHLEGLGWTR